MAVHTPSFTVSVTWESVEWHGVRASCTAPMEQENKLNPDLWYSLNPRDWLPRFRLNECMRIHCQFFLPCPDPIAHSSLVRPQQLPCYNCVFCNCLLWHTFVHVGSNYLMDVVPTIFSATECHLIGSDATVLSVRVIGGPPIERAYYVWLPSNADWMWLCIANLFQGSHSA